MRKNLILGVFTALVIFAAAPASAYYSRQGDLIKVSGNPAVYYVDSNGYRHLFPTEAAFFSWYDGSWRDQSVLTVSGWEFNQLPTGKNVTVRPGSSLIRFDNSLIMYAVRPGAKLCFAPAHYGNYQYNRAKIIPAGFQTDYVSDNNCDITPYANLPDGTLFRYINSNDIYYIQNGQRRRVTSYGMSANHFRYESVITDVDRSMSFPEGAALDGFDSSISDLNAYLYNYGFNNYNNYNYGYNYSCQTNWSCTGWTTCKNSQQNRNCIDLNNCNTDSNKPIVSQSCY